MSNILPVITLYQPWATWIMMGWKTIETRTHNRFALLKGQTILIHAGKNIDFNPEAFNNPFLDLDQLAWFYNLETKPTGQILGSVFVKDARLLTKDDSKAALIDCEDTTRYGLDLDHAEGWVFPIEEKGELGIWYYNVETQKKVSRADYINQGIQKLLDTPCEFIRNDDWINIEDQKPEPNTHPDNEVIAVLDYTAYGRGVEVKIVGVHYTDEPRPYGGPNALTGEGMLVGTYFSLPAIVAPGIVTHWKPKPLPPLKK